MSDESGDGQSLTVQPVAVSATGSAVTASHRDPIARASSAAVTTLSVLAAQVPRRVGSDHPAHGEDEHPDHDGHGIQVEGPTTCPRNNTEATTKAIRPARVPVATIPIFDMTAY